MTSQNSKIWIDIILVFFHVFVVLRMSALGFCQFWHSENFKNIKNEINSNFAKSRKRWTGLISQKLLIFFLPCLLQPCFGNEKFARESYFLYQVGSERRALRLQGRPLASTTNHNGHFCLKVFKKYESVS